VPPKVVRGSHRSAITPALNARRQPRHAIQYSIRPEQVDLPDMKFPADPHRPTYRLHQITGLYRSKMAGAYLDSHASLGWLDAHEATIRPEGLGEHYATSAMQNSERLDMARVHRHGRPGKVQTNFAQLYTKKSGQGLRMLGREFFRRYFPLPDPCSQFEPLFRYRHVQAAACRPRRRCQCNPFAPAAEEFRATVDLAVRHPLGRG
jgi:hypothetical protein